MPTTYCSNICTEAGKMYVYHAKLDHTHSPTQKSQIYTLVCLHFFLQHRHRYSRSDFTINQSEDEVQEIFQRTMRNRLESFKSAKMGVSPAKKITKHPKKETNQKVRTLSEQLIVKP